LQPPNNDSKPAPGSAAGAEPRALQENFFLGKKTRGQLRKMRRGIFETISASNDPKNIKFV